MSFKWVFDDSEVDWQDLSIMYKAAPLGNKKPADLKVVFINSKYKCFVYNEDNIIAAGRALADGRDASYICDVAVHSDYQGLGLGKKIIQYLINESKGHKKIILYANPGKEAFYAKFGFKKMNTAMAIFKNEQAMIENGTLSAQLLN